MCVLLTSLQSRCDLQVLVSLATFYCLQPSEQEPVFGRSLNLESNIFLIKFDSGFQLQWFSSVLMTTEKWGPGQKVWQSSQGKGGGRKKGIGPLGREQKDENEGGSMMM